MCFQNEFLKCPFTINYTHTHTQTHCHRAKTIKSSVECTKNGILCDFYSKIMNLKTFSNGNAPTNDTKLMAHVTQ